MTLINRVEENLKKLAEIKEKSPTATVIYMIRHDKDGKTVDIPLDRGHAETTIRNRPFWEVTGSDKQMDDAVAKLFEDPVEEPKEEEVTVPPKPSEELPLVKENEQTLQEPKPMQEEPKPMQKKPNVRKKSTTKKAKPKKKKA